MPGEAQEKRPNEIIQLAADFSQALLSAESIVLANLGVTVTNKLTDEDATSTILVSGSEGLSGDVISAQFQAGTDGEVYEVAFSTGATNLGNLYESTINLVITTSPIGDSLLVGLSELKTYLGITDTSEDTLLGQLLLPATRYIVARLGHGVFLTTYTEDHYIEHGEDNREIMLAHLPVQKIDSVSLMSADETVETTITDTTTWAFDQGGPLWFKHSYSFYRRPDFNRIVYRAGYPKPPEDLRLAVKKVAASIYRGIGKEGLSSERIGDYAWQAPQLDQLPPKLVSELTDPMIESIINRYKVRDIVGLL